MDDKKQRLLLRVILLLSGIAFLLLIVSPTKSGCLGCIVSVFVLAAVLWKTRVMDKIRKNLVKPIYIILGLLLCSALSCNFYDTWTERVGKLEALAGMGIERFVLVCAVCGALAAVPLVSVFFSYFISVGHKDYIMQKEKDSLVKRYIREFPAGKAFCILAAVYVIGISAILRANYNYVDDMGRVAEGYKRWGFFSRI